MTQKDQNGSMITSTCTKLYSEKILRLHADTFTINVHARVVVYMYLICVMTGQNFSRRANLHQSDVN